MALVGGTAAWLWTQMVDAFNWFQTGDPRIVAAGKVVGAAGVGVSLWKGWVSVRLQYRRWFVYPRLYGKYSRAIADAIPMIIGRAMSILDGLSNIVNLESAKAQIVEVRIGEELSILHNDLKDMAINVKDALSRMGQVEPVSTGLVVRAHALESEIERLSRSVGYLIGSYFPYASEDYTSFTDFRVLDFPTFLVVLRRFLKKAGYRRRLLVSFFRSLQRACEQYQPNRQQAIMHGFEYWRTNLAKRNDAQNS